MFGSLKLLNPKRKEPSLLNFKKHLHTDDDLQDFETEAPSVQHKVDISTGYSANTAKVF